MDSNELLKAFLIWTYRYGHQDINEAADAFLELPKAPFKSGWIQKARKAQLLSMERAAERAGISREAWRKLEQNEILQKITLESLQKAADALNCELVYGLRPKSGTPFSVQIWQKISKLALETYQKRTRATKIKPMVLATIAYQLMKDPEFRKKQGWSKNQPRK